MPWGNLYTPGTLSELMHLRGGSASRTACVICFSTETFQFNFESSSLLNKFANTQINHFRDYVYLLSQNFIL